MKKIFFATAVAMMSFFACTKVSELENTTNPLPMERGDVAKVQGVDVTPKTNYVVVGQDVTLTVALHPEEPDEALQEERQGHSQGKPYRKHRPAPELPQDTRQSEAPQHPYLAPGMGSLPPDPLQVGLINTAAEHQLRIGLQGPERQVGRRPAIQTEGGRGAGDLDLHRAAQKFQHCSISTRRITPFRTIRSRFIRRICRPVPTTDTVPSAEAIRTSPSP